MLNLLFVFALNALDTTPALTLPVCPILAEALYQYGGRLKNEVQFKYPKGTIDIDFGALACEEQFMLSEISIYVTDGKTRHIYYTQVRLDMLPGKKVRPTLLLLKKVK